MLVGDFNKDTVKLCEDSLPAPRQRVERLDRVNTALLPSRYTGRGVGGDTVATLLLLPSAWTLALKCLDTFKGI